MRSVHWFVLSKHLKVAKKGGMCQQKRSILGGVSHHKPMNKRYRNRCRTIHKNQRTMMRQQTCFSIVFGIASHENRVFNKVHVRETYEFINRMRIAEGSPRKKESKQRGTSINKSSKSRTRKRKAH